MHSLPRVLLLAPHFPPETVAGAARLGSLARELAALGHDVRVVPPGGVVAPPGRVVARRGRLGNVLRQLALRDALRDGGLRALESFRPDVVLVSSPPPVAALAGIAVADAARVPLVLDVRDSWPDVLVEAGALSAGSPAALALRLVERRLLRHAAAITTPTRTKVARLSERTAAPVILAVNGVDAAWCDAPPRSPRAGPPFEIVYAGNLGLAQDVELLVRASVRASHDVRVTIVGDGERREDVARAAARSGGRAIVLPPESREAVRDRLLRCGAAFVSLRTAELVDAVPSKLLEAMALGAPVIAAVAGEAASIVAESSCGLLVRPGDEAALSRAIDALAAMDAGEREAMGRRGREVVLARFRREDAARAVSTALIEVATRASR